tara:strand:- start:3550 stop:4659 length:1110 start_codon:yes stop_codon:yes gene_type:complete
MIKNILKQLSNPKIFVFTIIWMMFLVFIGTIAQKDIGLYLAQDKYFSNWFTWFWFIPTPGGRLVMLIMFINLASFLFLPLLWTRKKVGILIVHFGAVLLLLGGGLTAWFSFEGNMVLEEGASSNYIINTQEVELTIINTTNVNMDMVTAFDDKVLYSGKKLKHKSLPFSLEILEFHTNCEPIKRAEVDNNNHGLAKNFTLKPLPIENDPQMNRAGITFRISSSNTNLDGIYSIFLGQSVMQSLQVNNEKFVLLLRRERIYLPFSIQLNDFKQVLHPGTEIAKSFSSDIFLIDNDVSRRVLIQMNEPLRYKGYTFYQASFSQSEFGETSILAVVKNYGRLFPYISSIIMSIGLLIHLLIKLPILIKRKVN